MRQVSNEFMQAMAAVERRVLGRVQVDYTDPFLDQSITCTANEQANISYPAQTADGVAEPFAKIAALDGAWVLDGTFALAPGPGEEELMQMGWWGSQLADAGGYFSQPYPTLTVSFFGRPITRLTVVGDSKRGEYPADFTIRLYNGTTLLYTEQVTGNTQINWAKTLGAPVTQANKMELEISRWSHPGRQVKITEFYTSISEIYEGEDLISIYLLEEREVSNSSLPVGNISANEITVKLNNASRKFDADNKQSPLYQLLKPNRRIRAWLGAPLEGGTEWVPLGTFWSGDWKAPRDEVYVETTGRDRLELLSKSTFKGTQVWQNITLYQMAEAILQDGGLTPGEYWLDPALTEHTIPYAYLGDMSHREALRKVAEACLGQVYCDRDGVVRLETMEYIYQRASQYLLPFFSAEVGLSISKDDYYKLDRPTKWGQIANLVEVETQPLLPKSAEEVYRSNDPINVGPGQQVQVIAYYNKTPCINAMAALQGATNTVIAAAQYYAWGAELTLQNSGPTGEQVIITITAQPLEVANKQKAIARDDNSITEHGLIRYVYPGNPLVQTLTMAQQIADRLLASFKDPRRDIELEWRGNPALELGDVANVEGGTTWEPFAVVKQELEFAGALRAKLSARRL
ncbi:hypothetical protein SAMN02745885_01662 [Carboxydocella sporoproducens DSM 16521]|uniref:Uncharacterized protein n=2 Tax=Carboxydocella TaxID=178898 RepID=A0A1T4QFV6_9FIRM|nr:MULTISPECIES: hypothetical protein [Carboxydocella]AVX21589.1 hypothetical protein CFE_2446 [Carboxydocella thermautotrophica]SKA02673.1 hypothetical protein SAMN02745885_01662 [Carboxydocella sporoproducens DSM 16521]